MCLVVDSYCFLRIGNQRGFTLPFTNIIVNILAVNHDSIVILGVRKKAYLFVGIFDVPFPAF